MTRQRELRFYLSARSPVLVLLIASPFAALFGVVAAVSSDLGVVIIFTVFTIPFALGALNSLSMLVLLLLLRKPVFTVDSVGITYASPHMPWRSIHIPWDDVTSLNFLQQSFGSGRGASSRSQLLVYTKHPARYGSQLGRRLSTWWDPGFGDATIAISSGLIGAGSMEGRQWFMDSIKTTFAHEIAEHGIVVKLSM